MNESLKMAEGNKSWWDEKGSAEGAALIQDMLDMGYIDADSQAFSSISNSAFHERVIKIATKTAPEIAKQTDISKRKELLEAAGVEMNDLINALTGSEEVTVRSVRREKK